MGNSIYKEKVELSIVNVQTRRIYILYLYKIHCMRALNILKTVEYWRMQKIKRISQKIKK